MNSFIVEGGEGLSDKDHQHIHEKDRGEDEGGDFEEVLLHCGYSIILPLANVNV